MKKTMLTLTLGAAAAVCLLALMWFYCDRSIRQIDQQAGNDRVYDRHFILVTEDTSTLWQAVYQSAAQAAGQENVYLEWAGTDSMTDYSAVDCMNIAIASQVDGIILQPDGSEEIAEQIDAAMEAGIPVVTVLYDDTGSERISFVGVNSYQMGQVYGEQVLELLQEGENQVMVLLNASGEDVNTNLMYSQMNTVVERGKKASQKVEISTYSIDSSANFEAEEAIRNIFVNSEILPDILICLDPVSTECACQAIVDYNQVGNVNIIGYYGSQITLDAIGKGVIPSAVTIDTEELGSYSVSALNEYLDQGYVSNYFNVDLNVIDDTNIRQFQSKAAAE